MALVFSIIWLIVGAIGTFSMWWNEIKPSDPRFKIADLVMCFVLGPLLGPIILIFHIPNFTIYTFDKDK